MSMKIPLLALLALGCASETSISPDLDPEVPVDDDTGVTVDPGDLVGVDATTRGTEHWVAFMENLTLAFNGPPEFGFAIHADSPTQVTVELPQTGFRTQAEVPSGWSRVDLPDAVLYPEGSNVAGIHGMRITSEAPVEVVALHDRAYFSEASRLLPLTELGDRYRVVAAVDRDQVNRSSLIVAATRDTTAITIVPAVDTLALFGAGNPIEITLDAGETYQVHARGDLSGSLVEADAPIAVFGGAAEATIACNATSHAWEQVPPTRRWGTEYELVPLHGQGGDEIVVVADSDGTEVRVDCGEPEVVDAGERLIFELSDAARITASAPIAVGQLAKGADCTRTGLGDANLAIATPTALYRSDAVMYADIAGFLQNADGRVGYSLVRGFRGQTSADSDYVRDPSVPLEGVVRGVAFAVTSFDARSFSLGYDCIACVEDLVDAAECP